jgi:hypothetical protein
MIDERPTIRKHAPSLMFLVDEGDAVSDPIYSGIDTCLSGGYMKMLVTFNPRQRLGHPILNL